MTEKAQTPQCEIAWISTIDHTVKPRRLFDEVVGERLTVNFTERPLIGLAGPNEVIQLLGNAVFWFGLTGFWATKTIAEGFFSSLGECLAKRLLARFSATENVSEAPRSTNQEPRALTDALLEQCPDYGSIVFGFSHPNINSNRNIGIEIVHKEEGTHEIINDPIAAMAALATVVAPLDEFLTRFPDYEFFSVIKNNDASAKIALSKNGSVQVTLIGVERETQRDRLRLEFTYDAALDQVHFLIVD